MGVRRRHAAAALAIVLVVILAAAAGASLWLRARYQAPGPSASAVTVVVPPGTSTKAIGRRLAKAGVLTSPSLFAAEAELSRGGRLKAGEYAFPAGASIGTVLEMMRRGQVVVHKFTVAEGLTVAQALALLERAPALNGAVDARPSEGSLLPETYHYLWGETREALIARMARAMRELLADLWAARVPGLPLTDPEQALILASIVERETAVPAERAHVAAVFENRLRRHMRLQSDPTVIYALSKGAGVLDRALTRGDLAVASPYNTYAVEGLPPGPICNPGRASLAAVLHPAASDDLYFVADGGGGHVFARTLADHERNVRHWRAEEREREKGGAP